MSRFRQIILMIFFISALLISLVFLLIPGYLAPEKPEATAFLRDYHGRIALYEPSDDLESPRQVYDLYTRLLPENDVLALQAGIGVSSEEELERLLEDFGL